MYDSIIIGAGAAGLTAAIYTSRKKMKTLVISVDIGGQTNLTSDIQNYPGFPKIAGWDLMQKFHEKAIEVGTEFKTARINKVEKEEDHFIVHLKEEKLQTKTVILALGRVNRKLGIPGEEDFFGKGLHTCTTCDAPLYGGRSVAVIGGGNSALEGALELVKMGAKKVYLIHRREEFRGDEVTAQKVKDTEGIELVLSHVPLAISGERFVQVLQVEHVETKQKKDLAVDGIFLEIGHIADSSLVHGIVAVNDKQEIITDRNCQTNCPGIFAAGDITDTEYKQTVISAGEGAKAALQAHKYLNGGRKVTIDWK